MKISFPFFLLFACLGFAQNNLGPLSVEKIMRDPKWIGSSPSGLQWSPDSKILYFNWNPDKSLSDSLYSYNIMNQRIEKITPSKQMLLVLARDLRYNANNSKWVWAKNGDLFYQSIELDLPVRITQTLESESNPGITATGEKIFYIRGDNLFSWSTITGATAQLTNFIKGPAVRDLKKETTQESWLKADQLREFDVLEERKIKRDAADSLTKNLPKFIDIKPVYLDDKIINGLSLSPDGRYIIYRLIKPIPGKNSIVPNYVTESGFTEDIPARTKVGSIAGIQEMFILDTYSDKSIALQIASLPGIKDIPEYFKDYPEVFKKKMKDSSLRNLSFTNLIWSPAGTKAAIELRSQDNKDRWLCLVNLKTGQLKTLDRQHDEAWIAGPGIGGGFGSNNMGWIDEDLFWYQSEQTGFSHLYKMNVNSGEKTALTSGKYEVQQCLLSEDHKTFYITTNQVHPGEQHFYHLTAADGASTKLSTNIGAHQTSVSPDEKMIAYLYSYSTKPWELFIQENKKDAPAKQITDKAVTDEFKSYPWRDPQLITFSARDGATVYGRLYKPAKAKSSKPAVIFVHGAGYLQNAHKWWSSYFREYMFHNLLADQGYTVLDIDYRGSAGYGRDWRTGIYRFMGGKDLTDHLDAIKYLGEKQGVNPQKVGVYGGSYGGFITLMGLFTSPDAFAAGAALRPVTDWANYNHGYTANILNEPFTDSIAYKKSSPFYHAAGLKKPLLICHGMVDVNVHYQDAVKLAQRLIELKKDNWELASYPMEDHGFVEPSSWTDEYKRILKLFDTYLK